jgi:regulator of nucleoside diphosphate kinase
MLRPIMIGERDLQRLRILVASARRNRPRDLAHLDRLEDELDRAFIVRGGEVPKDVVTMNSEVRVKELESGRVCVYKIVFPRHANVQENRISVLAPLGTALLGYRAGDVIAWDMPSGQRTYKVMEIVYRPEMLSEAA